MNDIVEQAVAGLGYELLEAKRDRRGALQVTIDSAGGSAPVGSADCDKVCQHLNYLLPAEGVDVSAVAVSTPGPDRPLTKPEHFQRHRGARATIKLRAAREGRSSYTGTIGACDAEQVVLAAEAAPDAPEAEHAFSYADIAGARLCFDAKKYLREQGRTQ